MHKGLYVILFVFKLLVNAFLIINYFLKKYTLAQREAVHTSYSYQKMTRELSPFHFEPHVIIFSFSQRLTRERANSIGWGFEEFMAKHAGQNQDELDRLKTKQLFYSDGLSLAGRPVFYYIARRYM